MSKEDRRKIADDYFNGLADIDTLISAFEPLFYCTARKFNYSDIEETAQIARIAFLSSVKRFEPEKGASFECYAISAMRTNILKFILRQGLNKSGGELSIKVKHRSSGFIGVSGLNISGLANSLGISKDKAEKALSGDICPEVVPLTDDILDMRSPEKSLIEDEAVQAILREVTRLNERDRMIVYALIDGVNPAKVLGMNNRDAAVEIDRVRYMLAGQLGDLYPGIKPAPRKRLNKIVPILYTEDRN